MAVIDYLITDDEVEAYGVRAAPDMLTGTARQNKEVFDRLPVLIAKEHVNPVIRVFAGIENETQGWAADEQSRVIAEQERVLAESGRASAENDRALTEQERETAESDRTAAEQARAAAEAERDTAENARKTAESDRAAAEQARAEAEAGRAAAETGRAQAETARSVWEEFDLTRAYVPGNKVTFNGSSYLNTNACTGIQPPEDGYWLLIAKRGADGTGAGDMLSEIYDPAGRQRDVYAYADEAEQRAKDESRPRRNLLDNWYFANPINQRGQTSYSGNGYTIDRWTSNGGMSVVLTDSGLLLTANGVSEYGFLAEHLETLPPLGTTVTLSALVDGQLFSAGGKLTGSTYITITLSDSNSIVFDETNKRVYPMVYPNHPYTIYAIKLELGSQQTLAHQDENGNWVLNEIPDYGEQLARCQRYALALSAQSGHSVYGSGMFNDGQYARIVVPLPVTMRTVPSVSVSGDLELIIDGGYYTVNSVSVECISPTAVCLLVGSPVLSSTHSPAPALLRSYGGGKGELFLSAEL